MVLSSLGILACDCKSGLTFSVPPPPTRSPSLCFLCLVPLLAPVLPNPWAVLAGISMNQSLLSSHIYGAVSEAKPQRLMRLIWVSSNASGKAPASLGGGDQHELLRRVGAHFIYYDAIIKRSKFSAWFRALFTGRDSQRKKDVIKRK